MKPYWPHYSPFLRSPVRTSLLFLPWVRLFLIISTLLATLLIILRARSVLISSTNKQANHSVVPSITTRPADGIDASGAWWIDTSAPEFGHSIDVSLCRALEEILDGKDVLDLGAGIGLYGRCFLRIREPMFPNSPAADARFYHDIQRAEVVNWWHNSDQRVKSWTGYDGSPNIENATNGFVKHMDLTKPQHFNNRTYDFVLSLEVGEHIPAQHEATYIANILKPASEGIVLSWGVRGQDGRGHVNELNNSEVEDRMADRNFVIDDETWWFLRSQASYYWFQWSLLVFRPVSSGDSGDKFSKKVNHRIN